MKDISAYHCAGVDVPALIAKLKAQAKPYSLLASEALAESAAKAKKDAASLLRCQSILAEYADLLRRLGLVGEDRNAKVIYLAVTSRLLDKPVSVAVKGPSSAGKSYTVETVLKCFPPSAFYALTGMSERALAYSEEPLSHRMLVIYEAAGMNSDFQSYLLRTLISEGCVRYELVEKTSEGIRPRLIVREGPTGLLITTTLAALHPENETRLISLLARDDRAQTAGVLQALADRANGKQPATVDLRPWHALQEWLVLAGCKEVTIPYAHTLASGADPRAVRLRRDFSQLLTLIRAHAVLHQETRDRDDKGRIIAAIADYAEVYRLVIDLIAEGVQATVSQTTRDTVAAVAELEKSTGLPVAVTKLAERLGIDKGSASRRARVATEAGYLVNSEDKRGRPAKLTAGEPLPEESRVLPTPDEVEKSMIFIPSTNTATLQHSEAREVFEV